MSRQNCRPLHNVHDDDDDDDDYYYYYYYMTFPLIIKEMLNTVFLLFALSYHNNTSTVNVPVY